MRRRLRLVAPILVLCQAPLREGVHGCRDRALALVMATRVGLLGLEWSAPSGYWTTRGATPQEFDGTLTPLWGRNLLEEWASPAPCFAMACHAVC